ncbi:4-hydroxyphenylpyruvate dioxygenase [Fistulifera solaris]|uniref:4-hydroxyphenylpyruvate dioxygenase n=1 Tax=Fistulifera solaris TaxID=1519565 RepID=A0A1Z5KRD8_FISSO|nr:4-hydroxyphenylpyruvate dioxygenase [Fistulifera solaris]|eukprot:GAX28478.1 4-hydroxyphenylpyruvate dioxygenase [Fistulifera solaris]
MQVSSAWILLVGAALRVTALTAPSQQQWKPKIASLEDRTALRRAQYDSERIGTIGFHHVEFYCGDAKSMANRFALGLGMRITGSTGQHTGNDQCVSYGLESENVRFLLTAPYSIDLSSKGSSQNIQNDAPSDAPDPLPGFSAPHAHSFFAKHGLAARAVALEVVDADVAFQASVASGAKPVLEPTFIAACSGQKGKAGTEIDGCRIAEVELYGDVVLRYLSFPSRNQRDKLPFLPHLSPVEGKMADRETFGLQRFDHAVGNVPNLYEALTHIQKFTGFHEFAEFTPEDVGTVESGLNSVVLASDSEDVLLPLNEPTQGKRKSQIQTYLEQNEGAGLQHLALKTNDVFKTVSSIRDAAENYGGFELMKRPSDEYYKELPSRLGDKLTEKQYSKLEELGILADADDEGILLQIFTKPIGDRPTFFFEIIQRVGCRYKPEGEDTDMERPGCGGFGRGNFRELFKAIEEHERTLKV